MPHNDTEQQPVAIVGSPSSNFSLTLDLLDAAADHPLVGNMLAVETPLGGRSELALGTVTEVTTVNQWHQNPSMRGVIRDHGHIPNMSGRSGDVRAASVKLQACYTRDTDGSDWRQSGPVLRMSPSTATPVRVVTNDLIDDLMAGEPDLHYLGNLHGTDVRVPMNIRDFSGDRGAFHTAVFGLSGSGKALALDTPIATPTGWTAMGDLKDGDLVLDEQGKPCRVLMAHPVMTDRPCYEVVFSDGSTIVADAEHNWLTTDADSRTTESRHRTGEARRKRRPLLPPRITGRLRALAATATPEDVITLSEVLSLVEGECSMKPITDLARSVGALGSVTRQAGFVYAEQDVHKTRECVVFERAAVLNALAEQAETEKPTNPRFNPSLAPTLRAAAEDLDASNWITMPEIARLIDAPVRNGALLRRIVATGVTMARVRVPITAHVNAGTVMRRLPSEAAVYPKATLLTALADHADQPVGAQEKRTHGPRIITTEQIAASLTGPHGESNHAVQVAAPLSLPHADLPLDPYFLGIWLGDGASADSRVTTVDPEILMYLEGAGFKTTRYSDSITYGVAFPERDTSLPVQMRTVAGRLRSLDLLSNKHVPTAYLRASEEQRRALLAGLLDSDGTVSPKGSVHFDNTNERLADGVMELACSLGYRPTKTSKTARLNGRDCGLVFRIAFTTADEVFRLPRKQVAHKERTRNHNPAKTSRRYITDVRPVPSVPVRCITVDSPNSLYLAGKNLIPTHNTQMAAYMLAGQFRWADQGLIVIDPQGQWASETGMAFSLQGFAEEMGREVMVRRVSEDLRLEKDAPLFGELLSKTKFLRELMKMSVETQEILTDELVKVLRAIPTWTDKPSADLMDDVLRGLREPNVLRRVYADPSRQIRLMLALSEILGDLPEENPDGSEIIPGTYELPTPQVLRARQNDVLSQFAPLHNLFAATNPSGGTRHSLWGTISRVFDKAARAGRPAPMLVLDMSTSGNLSWLKDLLADGDADAEAERSAMDAIRILDQDNIKAAILRQTCRTLKTASEAAFRNGETLNTNVVFDEAWRYVPPPSAAVDDEIKALSNDLAGYFRDTRKFGIGWTLITQAARSINNDCYEQLSIRVVGYGLGGADLAKVGEQLDDPDHLKLYKAFAPPDSTRPKVYPFMIAGPVSPLSFTRAPVFLSAITDFEVFRMDNHQWIQQARLAQGLPTLTGTPVKPGSDRPAAPISAARIDAPRRAHPRVAAQQAERVREFASTGGVDPAAGTGLSRDAGFSNGLGAIDDDGLFNDPPF